MVALNRPRRRRRDPLGADVLGTTHFDHRFARFDGTATSGDRSDRAVGLVVGLHGLGANERQFRTLLPLDLDPGWVYVGLRAPIDYGPKAYSWYDPLQTSNDIDHRPVVDRVADFVEAAADRWDVVPDRRVVVGYSQAAGLAVALSSLRPRVATQIALGSAAIPPGLAELGGGRPTRAFVTVGRNDPFVDQGTLCELQRAWSEMRGGLTIRHYDIPHVMSPRVATDMSAWIRAAGTEEASDHGRLAN